MGYWPLRPEFNEQGCRKAGFEDSEQVEIRHCFFEAYHACGVQDAAGKAARLPIMQQIGFKHSIYNYNACYEWCQANQPGPASRTRDGLFAATGSFVWVALSDGLDSHSSNHAIIDLRTKTYRAVKGSSECWVFWARDFDSSNKPRILSRRLWCRCVNCRSGHACLLVGIVGDWTCHDVRLKSILTLSESRGKKSTDKEARMRKRADKAAAILGAGIPHAAGAAAVVAAHVSPAAAADEKDAEDGIAENELDPSCVILQADYDTSENEVDDDEVEVEEELEQEQEQEF